MSLDQFDEVQEAVNKAHENLLAANQLLRDSPAKLLIPKLDGFLAAEERPKVVIDAIRNIKRMAVGLDKEAMDCAATVGFTLLRSQGAVGSAQMKVVEHMLDSFGRFLEDTTAAITTKNFDIVPEFHDTPNDLEIQEVHESVLKIGFARALLEQTYADMILRRQTLIAKFEEKFCAEKSSAESLRAMNWRDWSAVAFQPVMAKLDPIGVIAAIMKFRESLEAEKSADLGVDGGDTQTILALEQGLQEESGAVVKIMRLALKVEVEARKHGFGS